MTRYKAKRCIRAPDMELGRSNVIRVYEKGMKP